MFFDRINRVLRPPLSAGQKARYDRLNMKKCRREGRLPIPLFLYDFDTVDEFIGFLNGLDEFERQQYNS